MEKKTDLDACLERLGGGVRRRVRKYSRAGGDRDENMSERKREKVIVDG